MRSLNNWQRKYFMQILNNFKTGKNRFYHFISGSGGVGKTRLISTLTQSLIRFFNKCVNEDLSKITVILSAFTGKASKLIGGNIS